MTLAFVLILTYSGISQISDNTFYLGGGIGFISQSSSFTKSNSNTDSTLIGPSSSLIRFTVGVGYFINEKISINADFHYATGSEIQRSIVSDIFEKYSFNTYNINPYLRYLLMLEENKFGFTFDTGLQYIRGTQYLANNTAATIAKDKAPVQTTFNIGITPGILYFPNEKIGLEASYGFIGYYVEKEKKIDQNGNTLTFKDSGFNFIANSLTQSLNFAFRYYFQR